MKFQPSSKCVAFVKAWEGFSGKAYHGAADRPDVWTIGYGTTKDVRPGMVITEPQGEFYLMRDLESCAQEISLRIPARMYTKYSMQTLQQLVDALVSWDYNTGGIDHSAGLEHAFAMCDISLVPPVLLEWDHVIRDGVRTIVPGLLDRRKAECRIIQENVYTGPGGQAL